MDAQENIQSSNLPRPVQQIKRTFRPDQPGGVTVEYRAFGTLEKWLQYRFAAWSTFKAWFVMTLVVVFFCFGGPGFVLHGIISMFVGGAVGAEGAAAIAAANQMILVVFLWLLGLVALISGGYYISKPTHLRITSDGLGLYFLRRFFNRQGRILPWSSITHISLWRPAGKTSPQDNWLWFNRKDGPPLKVKLGAIPTAEDRSRLMDCIDYWAPALTRDPDIPLLMAPPQDHSYTELWLQALSAPPKRERLTPLAPGAMLHGGRYCIVDQIGVGGQGTAYLARFQNVNGGDAGETYEDHSRHDLSDGQEVVLKESVLPVYVDVNVRRQALEKFQKEAAMLSHLDHLQIVSLSDFFVEDHRSYLVLEHISGVSLRKLVEDRGAIPESEVVGYTAQMCEILRYLHSLTPPVVHRDFTPDNLILRDDGMLKLVDFNVAQRSETTATGSVVGKHSYISPEQFRGRPTPQSDIYAMGATLYFLLTGKDPEPITEAHPILTVADLSPEMDKIVSRATTLDTGSRYRDIDELAEDLNKLMDEAAQDVS